MLPSLEAGGGGGGVSASAAAAGGAVVARAPTTSQLDAVAVVVSGGGCKKNNVFVEIGQGNFDVDVPLFVLKGIFHPDQMELPIAMHPHFLAANKLCSVVNMCSSAFNFKDA